MNLPSRTTVGIVLPFLALSLTSYFYSATILAGMSDLIQTPNELGVGIHKTLLQQIGSGRGNIVSPGSSRFIIKRDPFRAIQRGEFLFQRKFTFAQGLGPRTHDGIGNISQDASIVAGLTDSCAACHGRPRGSAGFGGEVFTKPDSRDAPHLFGLGIVEMIADEITKQLRRIRNNALTKAIELNAPVTRALNSKGINYGSIIAHPNGTFDTSGVIGVNPDLRVRPFFHEGRTVSIREFVIGAFSDEMGLEAYDQTLSRAIAGEDVYTPSGMYLTGSIDAFEAPPAIGPYDDPDGDGKLNEIPPSLVDFMEFYLLNYFRPGTYAQTNFSNSGKTLFSNIGCASCHVPNLTINRDRRVADVNTTFDAQRGGFNRLYASVIPLFVETDDLLGYPTKKLPAFQPFIVEGIYADFKRHDLGPEFWERNFDGSIQKLFMTEPLWGVGSTAPYGHDGRSINLNEVILRHGGEAASSRANYKALTAADKRRVIAFLETLVIFPPFDTASDLDPKNPNHAEFPQEGHGSIRLENLFNDPTDLE